MSDIGFIITDMQKRFLNPWINPDVDKDSLIENIVKAKEYCQRKGHPVIYLEFGEPPEWGGRLVDMVDKTDPTIEEILPKNERANSNIIIKWNDSGFDYPCFNLKGEKTNIRETYDKLGITKKVYAGVNAPCCVYHTMSGDDKDTITTSLDLTVDNRDSYRRWKGYMVGYLFEDKGWLAPSWQEAFARMEALKIKPRPYVKKSEACKKTRERLW